MERRSGTCSWMGAQASTSCHCHYLRSSATLKGDLKRTNLSLSGSVGDPTEAKGIICRELTVGSKTVPMAFFVVDVKGRYNVLLRRDWIHANECVLSTLHQCVIE
jgi:hypothetical protein